MAVPLSAPVAAFDRPAKIGASALHPVLDGLTLGEIEPLPVDESALVLEAGHAGSPQVRVVEEGVVPPR